MSESVKEKIVPTRTRAVAEICQSSIQSGRGRGFVRWRLLLIVALPVVTLIVGLSSTSSTRLALAIATVYAIAVLSNSVVLGGLNEINLGAGGWMAVGAYAMAIFLEHSIPLLVSVVLAVATTTLIGFVVAIPTVRLRGIFTALSTFVLAYSVPQCIVFLESITGGSHGKSVPFGLTLFGAEIGGSSPGTLVLVTVSFIVVGLATFALLESRWGKTVIWVAEAEPAAAVFGVRTTAVKVAVWTWSAALSGLAGALFALTLGFLSPDQFQAALGINLFVGAVIGGSRSIWAALVGGLLIGFLPTQLQDYMPSSATGILFGGILLVAILAGAGGLARPIEKLLANMQTSLRRTPR